MGSHIFLFLFIYLFIYFFFFLGGVVFQFIIFTVSKRTRMFVPQMKNKVFFIRCKKWVNS